MPRNAIQVIARFWVICFVFALIPFGLPAVLNIPRVTEAVEDGETIEVDGFAGVVRRTDVASLEEGTS